MYLLGSDTAGECSQIRVTPDIEIGIWSGFLNSMVIPIASAKNENNSDILGN